MSAPKAKSAAELFDVFIKLEWQDIFRKEIHVRLDNGARYVPNSGPQGVQLLRKNAFDEAIRIWSGPNNDPDSGTQGYDRIVEQAGIEYTWEWFLIDPSRPWARAVPELVRQRIEADLASRDQNARARAKARAEEAERLAEAGDDAVIASMNARRSEQAKEPLSTHHKASVRESQRNRRHTHLEPTWGSGMFGHPSRDDIGGIHHQPCLSRRVETMCRRKCPFRVPTPPNGAIEPKRSGIIIRVSGVRVPPPA